MASMLPRTVSYMMNSHEQQLCTAKFSYLFAAEYFLFKLYLNVADFDEQIKDNFVSIFILHITCHVTLSVLMLNLMTALFADSVSAVSRNKDIIVTIQHLGVMHSMWETYGRLVDICLKDRIVHRMFRVKNNRCHMACVFVAKDGTETSDITD